MSDAPATSPGGPFEWLAAPHRARALVLIALLTSVLSLWLAALGAPLSTDAAPDGIVSFELARNATASGLILDSWNGAAREAAMLVQGVDFLFLLAYPAFFSLAAVQLAARLGGRWRSIGVPLAWAVWLATPLDVVENLALIRQIEHGPSDGAAFVAWACALPKFGLVFAGAGFVVAGLAAMAVARLRSSGSNPVQ